MITHRLILRLWDEHAYDRLIEGLAAGRSDLAEFANSRLRSRTAAAALAVIRLDELSQNANPLCVRLVRAIINEQQTDGGWGDIAVTVLAIRALRCGNGDGVAIARGIDWLAMIQKDDGAWPVEPIRRLPADAAMTSFVLLHLGSDPSLNAVARLHDALGWLANHRDEMDAQTRRTADRVTVRRRRQVSTGADRLGLLFAEPAWS